MDTQLITKVTQWVAAWLDQIQWQLGMEFDYLTLLGLIVAGVFVLALLAWVIGRVRRGDIIYADQGRRSHVFKNAEYGIQAKPDLLRKILNGVRLEEYKGRNSGFYPSDRSEALAAALAVRGEGVPVTEIMLRNQTQARRIQLPALDSELYSMIERDVEITRKAIAAESVPIRPVAGKCRTCGFRADCDKRAA